MRLVFATLALALLLPAEAAAGSLDIRDALSPRNRKRPPRPHTKYIVLHTTEGPGRGSLDKLRRDGEAHYLVDERGRVTRIIDKHRVAYHAGISMWEGRRDLDRWSIGIEVAGYHDRALRPAQLKALRELLRQLQSIYGVPDDHVLTHSMVAYGRPNRYHRYPHRGRKRCGMVFARADVRRALGLSDWPAADPDVRAGRLRVADASLRSALYRGRPSKRSTSAAASAPPRRPSRAAAAPPKRSRAGTPREVPRVISARAFVGSAHDDLTTIYLFPSGLVRTGRTLSGSEAGRRLLDALPVGTRVILGHMFGGYVTAGRAPSEIAGSRWNDPSTLYRLPDGRILPGHRVDASRLPQSTLVFPST